MLSDRDPLSEHEQIKEKDREIAALKKLVDRLSHQVYGRVMPGLYALPNGTDDDFPDGPAVTPDAAPENVSHAFRESAAPYHAFEPVIVPPDLPSDEVKLELSSAEAGGMSVLSYESSEAIAARPAVVSRTIRRAMYVSNDGSGMSGIAPAPALFPDPSGGPRMFDASFVAFVTDLHMAGMPFRLISGCLKTGSGLVISEAALRRLVLTAAETLATVCADMVVRRLPNWTNLRRMFEDARTGGDWLADEFLQKIHALSELEEYARNRGNRSGGSPDDLYRERRAVRTESARIATKFFERCGEVLPAQNPQSPLAGALRYAMEHESILSSFLHDPAMEMICANPETPVADPFAVLAVCVDECRMRGISFRSWLENALVRLKQSDPPSPDALFPR